MYFGKQKWNMPSIFLTLYNCFWNTAWTTVDVRKTLMTIQQFFTNVWQGLSYDRELTLQFISTGTWPYIVGQALLCIIIASNKALLCSGTCRKFKFLQAIITYLEPFICKTHTLNSVTGSGHVKYKRNSLACKIHENAACNHLWDRGRGTERYM